MSGESAIERVGGKAAGLAALADAGLPVPAWIAIPARALPAPVRAVGVPAGPPDAAAIALLSRARADMWAEAAPDVTSALPNAPGPFAVRSSTTLEDRDSGAAAGLFASVLDVDRAGLADAVRQVWTSALTPAVWTYLAARGLSFDDLRVAVIVQAQIAPAADAGTTYTRHPTDPDALLVEATTGWRAVPRAEADGDDVARLALAAARAIGRDDADVEWVRDRDGALWVVQARAVPAQPRPPGPPADAFAFTIDDDAEWRWDVTHNPEPLSPAQIGLVERVDRGDLRVVHGYLYARTSPVAPGLPAPAPVDDAPLTEMARILDAAETAELSVSDAVDAYAAVYEHYCALAGPLARARRELPALLETVLPATAAASLASALLGGESDARLESLIARVARGELDRAALDGVAGPMAPAWDVAVPTYAETPALLDAAIDAARAHAATRPVAPPDTSSLPAAVAAALPAAVARARRAADLAELDDRCFFRAQALVRRALARLGDDAFWVPLADAAAGAIDAAVAASARATWRAQQILAMPLAVRRGDALPPPAADSDQRWRGRGAGGQASGPVVRVDAGAAVPAGAIAIAPTITPAMAVLVRGAAALVSEHGGLLDHGAAIARELGIPCVVGCAGVVRGLQPGERAWVDGAAGVVIRLGPPAAR